MSHEKSHSEIVKERIEKIKQMCAEGTEPYGKRFLPIESIQSVRDNFEENKKVTIAGRFMTIRSHGKSAFADVKDETARIQVYFRKDVIGEKEYGLFKKLDLGDIVGLEGECFKSKTGEMTIKVTRFELLSKIVEILPEKWHGLKDIELRHRRRYLDLIANDEVRDVFKKRSTVIRRIREMLDSRGFMEVETPMMQTLPGGAKAEPFKTHHNTLHMDLFLRIAPELYLKRLLIGGFEKVYEINRNFRNEGLSPKHNPEFTMMEIYQAYADYTDMMKMTEEVISELVKEVTGGGDILTYGEKQISFKRPWKQISFYGSLKEKTGVDWEKCDIRKEAKRLGVRMESHFNDADIINEVFGEKVEPELSDPTFVVDYPLFMSPLAKQKKGNPNLVDRFELFISSMEIANAFSELNDPFEQRKRFEEQVKKLGEKEIDEDFCTALTYGMPPAGGLGIGIDRLVMILTNSQSIREVILFPHLRPETQSHEPVKETSEQ